MGINTATPLHSSEWNFLANLEAAQRTNPNGAAVSGQFSSGLFSFNVPGQTYDDKWLKGGVGLEGKVGRGKLFLMLNGTTNSAMPNAWLTTSYQVAF